MAPEGLRLVFKAGIFITGLALLSVVLLPRDSAEFVAAVLSLVIGVTLLLLVWLASWWSRR